MKEEVDSKDDGMSNVDVLGDRLWEGGEACWRGLSEK